MEKKYVLVAFTEDKVGLANRITLVLTRRKINIDSLNSSETEVPGIFRFTIVIKSTEERAIHVVKQFEKIVDVIAADYYELDEVILQEVAMYKVPTEALLGSDRVETLTRKHFARIMYVGRDFVVIEKTGKQDEINALYRELEQYGVIEFVRSGSVALTKYMQTLHTKLQDIARAQTS